MYKSKYGSLLAFCRFSVLNQVVINTVRAVGAIGHRAIPGSFRILAVKDFFSPAVKDGKTIAFWLKAR